MKTRIFALLIALTAPAMALDEEDMKAAISELPAQADTFTKIEIKATNTPTPFEIPLGDHIVKAGDGLLFNGLLLTVPDFCADKDFVWYFNGPENWGHWYIIPLKGEPNRAFTNWLDADMLYQGLDQPTEEKRLRVLQSLHADYFKAGESYLLWFRQAEPSAVPTVITGTLAFVDPQDEWNYQAIEKALNLKPMPVSAQVSHLKSRGGQILLDEKFFSKNYAQNRIEDVFTSIRRTHRMSNGFFITMEISIPPCNSSPAFADIRKKYGEPDFILTSTQQAAIDKHNGNDPSDDDDACTIFFYDYFGFRVPDGSKDGVVSQVTTQASNYSHLLPTEDGNRYSIMAMQNLAVFYHDRKEVGRMHYFLKEEKTPLCIKEPPPAVYLADQNSLEYMGDGKWFWSQQYPDGKPFRSMEMANHQFHGTSRGYHPDGKPSFTVEYAGGMLHGNAIRFDNQGNEIQRTVFKHGEREENTDEATQEDR